MIPHIPDQRKFRSNTTKPFNDLIKYIEGDQAQEQGAAVEGPERGALQETSSRFDDILNYATAPVDKDTKAEKCIAIRTNGVTSLQTASIEMNAVSRQNSRCKDPAYHIILSWPEHEKPDPALIFDAAEHAIKSLGLAEHQYVIAVHDNTDNRHCHISVNRVHPVTFKSRNIEWAVKTLHFAARESEVKHGWTHDNGIYVVETNGHGKKSIVLNKDFGQSLADAAPRVHRDLGEEATLPSWHDPDSLDSWLKKRVAKDLKHALQDLQNWQGLHAWLDQYQIGLTDSGGGGMRLHATSAETGEIIDIPASKGLRALKRADLEKRWGPFRAASENPLIAPDFSHLSPEHIEQGVEDVINRTLDQGEIPEHILRAQSGIGGPLPDRSGGMHELSGGGVDSAGQDGDLQLQGAVPAGMGNHEAGQDQDVRRTGTDDPGGRGEGRERSIRSLNRNDAMREVRKAERAAARADLRQRFAQYRRFVQAGDTEHFQRMGEAQAQRKSALSEIRAEVKAAKAEIQKHMAIDSRLMAAVAIDAEAVRRKLQAEASFQERARALRAIRTPPLSWRAWLHEQSNLGDQAALSALRGIVYQAQRDAKKVAGQGDEETLEEDSFAAREREYRKVMKKLLEEEQREVAIRAARSSMVRPYEADALLKRYVGMQWQVTGNGNVEYNDVAGRHVFTDRGNRLTFDRVFVTDDEIRLALVHAQNKFGRALTLTGADPVFTHRMARLADDLGIVVLNPELRVVVEQHRAARVQGVASGKAEAVHATAQPTEQGSGVVANNPVDQGAERSMLETPLPAASSPHERLRAMVLAIDPGAKFVVPDVAQETGQYFGPVAAELNAPAVGFAQHVGRSVYAIHDTAAPEREAHAAVVVNYKSGAAHAAVDDGKGRGDKQL